MRTVKEKRIVYDTFMMLGDVGGLGDVLILGVASLVGIFSEPIMTAGFISKLYR